MFMVTGAAGAAFFLVDVQVMEVALAVAESSHLGLRFKNHLSIVAAETEFIARLAERRVKTAWEIIFQQTGIIRAVGIVTGGARTLARRSMHVTALGDLLFDVGQNGTIAQGVSRVMTSQTKVAGGFFEQRASA